MNKKDEEKNNENNDKKNKNDYENSLKNREKELKIDKDMSIIELIHYYPDTIEVFLEFGLQCIGCPFAMMETIEQGAKAHGMDDDKIKELIEKLNEVIKKSREKEE